jgi:Cof subfamily protein (haloacid dehalogenase superfamily)
MKKSAQKRLFVFDIDNTLLPAGYMEIPSSEVKAINCLLSQGDVVAIASGRPYMRIKDFLDSFTEGEKYAIAANGSDVCTYSGVSLDAHYLSFQDLLDVYNKHHNDNLSIYSFSPDGGLIAFSPSKWVDREEYSNKIPRAKFHFVGSYVPDKQGHDIYKIMIAGDIPYSKDVVISEEEKEKYSVVRSSPRYIEIMPKGIDKGTAVDKLREHLGISPDDVYCFGDSGNDVLMLSSFHGVAPSNGTKEAKQASEYITKSCLEGGVSYALKDILKVIS